MTHRHLLGGLLAASTLLALPTQARALGNLTAVGLTRAEGDASPGNVAFFNETGPCAPSKLRATIDWGDGDVSQGVVRDNDGQLDGSCNYRVVAGHAYGSPGARPFTVAIANIETNAAATASGTFDVVDAAITGEGKPLAGQAGQLVGGLVAEFVDGNTGGRAESFDAVIDWGDGSTSPGTVSGSGGRYAVHGDHRYPAAGNYLVRITLVERGVKSVSAEPGTASITAPTPPAPAVANGPAGGAPVTGSSVPRGAPVAGVRLLGGPFTLVRVRRNGLQIETALGGYRGRRLTFQLRSGRTVLTSRRLDVSRPRTTNGARLVVHRVRLGRRALGTLRAGRTYTIRVSGAGFPTLTKTLTLT